MPAAPAGRNGVRAAGEGATLDLHQTRQRWHTLDMHLATPSITLDSYNLASAERRLCVEALTVAGNIVGAAKLLGITRHAMKRRIIKLDIAWSRELGQIVAPQPVVGEAVVAHAA